MTSMREFRNVALLNRRYLTRLAGGKAEVHPGRLSIGSVSIAWRLQGVATIAVIPVSNIGMHTARQVHKEGKRLSSRLRISNPEWLYKSW